MNKRPRAVIRSTPEDFRVVEIPKVMPSGEGEHLLVEVRKRGANTAWVAGQLARWAGVPPRAVSWAGLKDRNAVTEQWFSVHCPGRDPDTGMLAIDGVELLSVQRHSRKLRRGTLTGNRFRIVLRELGGKAQEVATAASGLEDGFPNRFGTQRFGREGRNVERAHAWLCGGGRPPRDRNQRGMLLSAARSYLFNIVLDRRIEDGSWNSPLAGDIMALDGSGSRFRVDTVDESLQGRCREGDIHPTGPLCGRGSDGPGGEAARVEQEALEPHAELVAALATVADSDRRALRVIPKALITEVADADTLVLEFQLPPGAYATTLLDALVEWREGENGC
jgi:tRNA pseudouridine13 synthase